MGWLTNRIDEWAVVSQQKELSAFIYNLRSMDSDESGVLVAVVTDFKNHLEPSGHLVSDPIVYYAENPKFPLTLGSSIKDLQRFGKTQEAAGLLVWLHTMRAGARLELRQLGRERYVA